MSFQRTRCSLALALWGAMMSQAVGCGAQMQPPQLMPLGQAWAANSINTVVFRADPISTHGQRQYAAYYDADGRVVIATRSIGQRHWRSTVTDLRGNIKDAHNAISIMADGRGMLHVSWDHHGHPLRYALGASADRLKIVPMTGRNEQKVTYPQFFQLPGGDLLFLFRDGASGRGNLVMNRYDLKRREWQQLHANLISGEEQRNAYWQTTIDSRGRIHLSWVWRETGDVATNHDLCYARSDDGGETWLRSDGSRYELPITAATAEVALQIPQKHELINSTSMCADDDGRPIIATYFRPQGERVVQYFVVHHDGSAWRSTQVTQRTMPFSLSGGGSKQIPISRPQIVSRSEGGKTRVWMVFRDIERGNRVSVAYCGDLARPHWKVRDLTHFGVRYWEPSYDSVRWKLDGVLSLYVQVAGQGDAETLEDVPPQTAYVLEWIPSVE